MDTEWKYVELNSTVLLSQPYSPISLLFVLGLLKSRKLLTQSLEYGLYTFKSRNIM